MKPSPRPVSSATGFAAPKSRLARGWIVLLAAVVLAIGIAPFAGVAETEEQIRERREGWQSDYRALLMERERYKFEIAKAQKDYVLAQRRNYPRGGARQQILLEEEKAKESLAETQEKLKQIFIDARAASVPPGWLLMVEDEEIEYVPAALDASADDDDDDDNSGRNPLFFDDDDDDEGDDDDDDADEQGDADED